MLSAVQEFAVALTFPPTLSLCLLGCGFLAWLLHRRRIGAGLMVFALAWSALWSIPWFSAQLRGSLGRQNPIVAEAALPKVDAIVVLGGGHYGNWMSRDSVDPDEFKTSRLAAGARAWFAGRAPLIILSGGSNGGRHSEAQIMALAIAKTGIPASALLLEEESANTSDNARLTAALARKHGVRKVLLVTSTVHMPRASLLFRDAGIDVVPVPVPEGQLGKSWRERWLPSPYALWRSGRALKEYAALFAIRAQHFVGGAAEPVPTDSEM